MTLHIQSNDLRKKLLIHSCLFSTDGFDSNVAEWCKGFGKKTVTKGAVSVFNKV